MGRAALLQTSTAPRAGEKPAPWLGVWTRVSERHKKVGRCDLACGLAVICRGPFVCPLSPILLLLGTAPPSPFDAGLQTRGCRGASGAGGAAPRTVTSSQGRWRRAGLLVCFAGVSCLSWLYQCPWETSVGHVTLRSSQMQQVRDSRSPLPWEDGCGASIPWSQGAGGGGGGQQQGPEVQSPSLTVPALWWLCPSRPRRPALGAWGSQPSWCLPTPGHLLPNAGPQLQLRWQRGVRPVTPRCGVCLRSRQK